MTPRIFALFTVLLSALTLKPKIIELVTLARETSDSVIPPTIACEILIKDAGY